ncbi:MAG: putative 4-hydroxybenzoate polyprenyltransferase [Chloroflexi bacterium]|nr:putative 4-hydroxybenzoate polyprenyltransferase [Chloroflexota bacterium]
MSPSAPPGALNKLGVLFEQIRFEHSIFALPFAYLGMVLAARGWPTLPQIFWITIAMVAARTFAMSMNRVIDWQEDRLNPRTRHRPLPSGRLKPRDVLFFSAAALAVMVFAAWQLNPLCVLLSPVAAVILGGYTYIKRVSWLYHFAIGIGDAGAPIGGWVAVTGSLAWEPILLGLAVAVWVTGFDLIYTCQDYQFDREHRSHSMAKSFGIKAALAASAWCHVATVALLALLGVVTHLGPLYWVGVAGAAGLLLYEHRLVKADDLSRLNMAFFNVNGYIAVLVFVFTVAGLATQP